MSCARAETAWLRFFFPPVRKSHSFTVLSTEQEANICHERGEGGQGRKAEKANSPTAARTLGSFAFHCKSSTESVCPVKGLDSTSHDEPASSAIVHRKMPLAQSPVKRLVGAGAGSVRAVKRAGVRRVAAARTARA